MCAGRRFILEGRLCAPLLAARPDVVEELLWGDGLDGLESADVDLPGVVLTNIELCSSVEEVVHAVPRDLEKPQSHLETAGGGAIMLAPVRALELGGESKDVGGGVRLDAHHRVRFAAACLPVGEARRHDTAENGGLDEGAHDGVVDGRGVTLVAKGVVKGELCRLDGLGVVDAFARFVDVEARVPDGDAVDGLVEDAPAPFPCLVVLAV